MSWLSRFITPTTASLTIPDSVEINYRLQRRRHEVLVGVEGLEPPICVNRVPVRQASGCTERNQPRSKQNCLCCRNFYWRQRRRDHSRKSLNSPTVGLDHGCRSCDPRSTSATQANNLLRDIFNFWWTHSVLDVALHFSWVHIMRVVDHGDGD